MLEKPDFPDEKIVTCLQAGYGLTVVSLTFLPLGADHNAAVYRAISEDACAYFVKLRRGAFDEIAVTFPNFLSDRGISQIIPPLATKQGALWANLAPYTLILYPFVEAHNGYQTELSAHHWREFGQALKRIHTAAVPAALTGRIPGETFSPYWRDRLRYFLVRVATETFADPVAAQLARLFQAEEAMVGDLLARTERLAETLQRQPRAFVVCHSDVDAGNVLIDQHGAFYIVDWDNPILAPKERDLMFPGGGQGFRGHSLQEEEMLFYEGYGQTSVDAVALAYYRYQRIIEDLAVYCEQLLESDEGGEDRAQSLYYVRSNFLPNGTLAIAYQSDRSLSP